MTTNPPSHPNNVPPAWACTPRLVLPPDAPTAGYLCGGGGLMTAGFEIAGIRSLWNIDRDPTDPKLSSAIAKVYEQNFGYAVIGETLQKVVNSGQLTDLQPPDILVLTQPCKHLSRSNPKAKETSNDISTAEAAVTALETFLSPVFVVENVPEYQHSISWSVIKSALAKLGYNYHAQIVNTADYGVPQERHRFIAIALKQISASTLTIPTTEHPIGWYEAISDLLPTDKDIEPTATQLQRIATLPAHCLEKPLLIERVGAWGNPKVRLPEEPSWTIRKSIWLDQRHNSRANAINIRLPDGSWKNLGIRGAARLMTLPDWFKLPDAAWIAGSALGNGVPCLLATAIANAVKPLLIKSNPEDLTYVLEQMLSSEKVEVALETQERTSNIKKATNTLTQNQVNWSITMPSTTKFVATNQLQGFTFADSITTDTVELAKEVIQLGNSHAATFVHLKEQALELGDKLKELEAVLGKTEFQKLLKHCFPKELVRYFRNLTVQAKLIAKFPNLQQHILNLPLCHAALLLAGSESQVEAIAKSQTKWTISLIKERLASTNERAIDPTLTAGCPVVFLNKIGLLLNEENELLSIRGFGDGEIYLQPVSELRALDKDTFDEFLNLLATISGLNEQLNDNERTRNDIEGKLGKLNKCQRSLMNQLMLTDEMIDCLNSAIDKSLSLRQLTDEDIDRAFRIYHITDTDAVLAKANLLARLRVKDELNPQPTIAELIISIATYLHKLTTKHGGGGIPITTREYNELIELVQQQNRTIAALKTEIAEVKENSAPIDNISIASELTTLQLKLNQYQQLINSQEQQIKALQEQVESASVTTIDETVTGETNNTIEPGTVVKIVKHPIHAGKLGLFTGSTTVNDWRFDEPVAVGKVVLKPGTKWQFPLEINNYTDCVEPSNLTLEQYQQLVELELIAEECKKVKEELSFSQDAIEEAVYQLGKCLALANVPGWDNCGNFTDEDGTTLTGTKALRTGVTAITELLSEVFCEF
ncbi:DNA cytosine methyltransferase [Aerosakkonemataceae cyanobacterium BLCC-F50]|uniref:DNA (cytosine-5-)-methyltransferase n=1 Tax=Floridaenema flaviceps BLCC-F50 TaxID=3153642 RepID=A0ABV4Y092_9CYAN